jgi:hypothetical protein
MFERGSKAADHLSDQTFINFEGLRKVSGKLYRDVVATSPRASLSPIANRREMLGFNGRPVDALEWMRTLKLSSNAIRSVTAILFSHTVKGRPEADRSPASKGRGFVVRASVATNQKDEPPMNRGAAGFQEGRLLGVEGDRARRRRGISIRYAVFYRKGNGVRRNLRTAAIGTHQRPATDFIRETQ